MFCKDCGEYIYSEPESEPESESEPEPESELELDPEPELDPESELELDPEPELVPDFKNLSNEQKIDIFVFLPISDIFLNDIALIISEYYGNYIECDYCYEIANEICSKCDQKLCEIHYYYCHPDIYFSSSKCCHKLVFINYCFCCRNSGYSYKKQSHKKYPRCIKCLHNI